MSSEAEANADFSVLRYAQCWEDADILLDALNIQPGQTCLSIASAGDNALAMLSRGPARVIALDLNPAQLAALELRVAAYRELSHAELLILIGSSPGNGRERLYRRCRSQLSPSARAFWDARSHDVQRGIGAAGNLSDTSRCSERASCRWSIRRHGSNGSSPAERAINGWNFSRRNGIRGAGDCYSGFSSRDL